MDDRGANIDLAFRNGLKDYEVLPPPEVWDNIHPAIKIKTRSFVYVRAAAFLALGLTMSFLALKWSKDVSGGPDIKNSAFEIKSGSPEYNSVVNRGNSPAVKSNTLANVTENTSIEDAFVDKPVAGNYNESSPLVATTGRKPPLINGNSFLRRETSLIGPTSSQRKTLEIISVNQGYFPETDQSKNNERWSIAAMASPTYYSSFSSGSELSKQLAATEQPILSYSGGLAVSYQINKRFSIQSGLYYSSMGQRVDGVSAYSGFKEYTNTKGGPNFELLTTSGNVYTNNADVYLLGTSPTEKILSAYNKDVFDPKKASLDYLGNTIIQNFNYLELPVILRYKIIDKTINFNLIGGVSYNLLVSNSVYSKTGDTKYPVGATEGLSPLSISSSLGIGMGYNISKKISLNFEPTFRYYLNPFNEATGPKNHPYSIGVFSGLSYKF
jgi:hypothetical protein